MDELFCYTCRGTDFYEDRMGNFSCKRCGAVSQDYFAVSHEIDVSAPLARASIRTIKTKVRKRRALTVEDITPMECITIYQHCLRNLSQTVAMVINSAQLVDVVKSIWFRYLDLWRRSGGSMKNWFSRKQHSGTYLSNSGVDSSSSGAAKDLTGNKRSAVRSLPFTNDSDDSANSDNDTALKSTQKRKRANLDPVDVVAPTKPLLLGFLYLAIRTMRSWVIPADLSRWCIDGILPIANLFDSGCIPQDYVERFKSVHKSFERKVFSSPFLTDHFQPTCSNILFHATALADMLELPFPPLNGLLVSRRLISSLGLPEEAWLKYRELIHIYETHPDPLKGSDPYRQHYVENLAATVLMACKLCPDWRSWSVDKSPPINRSGGVGELYLHNVPTAPGDLDSSLARYQLPQYLEQLSSIVMHSSISNLRHEFGRGKCSYNSVIDRAIQHVGIHELAALPPSSCCDESECVWNPQLVPCVPRAALPVELPPPKRSHLRKPEGEKRYVREKKNVIDKKIYYEYLAEMYEYLPGNIEGCQHESFDPQYTVLLERVARYVCIWPGVLHVLLLDLERQLPDSPLIRKTADCSPPSATGTNEYHPNTNNKITNV